MAGAYCKFCDQRCFVDRKVPNDSWSGYRTLHMATCPGGMEHDWDHTGYDYRTAINPYANRISGPADGSLTSKEEDWDRLERVRYAWTLALVDADYEAQTLNLHELSFAQLQLIARAANDLHEYARTMQSERIRNEDAEWSNVSPCGGQR